MGRGLVSCEKSPAPIMMLARRDTRHHDHLYYSPPSAKQLISKGQPLKHFGAFVDAVRSLTRAHILKDFRSTQVNQVGM